MIMGVRCWDGNFKAELGNEMAFLIEEARKGGLNEGIILQRGIKTI